MTTETERKITEAIDWHKKHLLSDSFSGSGCQCDQFLFYLGTQHHKFRPIEGSLVPEWMCELCGETLYNHNRLQKELL